MQERPESPLRGESGMEMRTWHLDRHRFHKVLGYGRTAEESYARFDEMRNDPEIACPDIGCEAVVLHVLIRYPDSI